MLGIVLITLIYVLGNLFYAFKNLFEMSLVSGLDVQTPSDFTIITYSIYFCTAGRGGYTFCLLHVNGTTYSVNQAQVHFKSIFIISVLFLQQWHRKLRNRDAQSDALIAAR